MNSLLNYGSDDDYEDTSQDKKSASSSHDKTSLPQCPQSTSQTDVNYEEVQMDLSEDSNGSSKNDYQQSSKARSEKYSRSEYKERSSTERNHKDSPKRRYHDDDRYYKERDSKYRDREDKDRERNRDKYRDRDRNREDKYKDERRRRSRSRSRSPSRKDYRRRSRTPERGYKQGYSRRYDRSSNKMAQLEKLGIEIKSPEGPHNDTRKQPDSEKDRFYMPGITGRFKEQIERRKLLWQKKECDKPAATKATITAPPTGSGKVWEATTFAQDQDGKVASKFKRLMGIKDASAEANKSTDTLKKQEEMFHSMEQQYEVARTATHTMRGVGLGFGSYQR